MSIERLKPGGEAACEISHAAPMRRLNGYLPQSLRRQLRLIGDAVQNRLYRPSHLRLWLHDWLDPSNGSDAAQPARDCYQRALIDWLKAAQDAVPGGGVAGYYSLEDGWSAAYPETTGYIIVTAIDASKRLGDKDLAARTRRMADWEVQIQLPEGAWQSGLVTAPRIPAVFNTGQVIQGLLAAYREYGEPAYLKAAIRGGRWLIANQDEDGAWRKHTYGSFPNSYSTRVAWPLLILADATRDPSFRKAATKYLEWASGRQDDSGWFELCTLEADHPPLTHTLAYTIEGFVEAGVLLGSDRWIEVGRRAADALLHRFELRRHLAGAYDKGWSGDHSFSCLTGCAQMSQVWGRLFEITGDARYLNALLKLNDFVVSHINLTSRNPGIRGGVPGSHPLWEEYMTYRLPSWAAKFALDALFIEGDVFSDFLRRNGTARIVDRSLGESREHHNLVRLQQ